MSEQLKKWHGWDELLKAQENGVVIGLGGVTGVVARLDIDEMLLTKPDTFNLFLLALRDLQEDPDTTKPMGYFQIAGWSWKPLQQSLRCLISAGRRHTWTPENNLERS